MNKAWDDSAETTSLLQLAGQGNDDAFKALMDRHLQPVRKSVRRRLKPQLRPRIDPSDVIQETQEKAFRELPDFLDRRPMPFRLWLLKTAHQRMVSIERKHLRAAKRSVERELPLPDESSLRLAGQFRLGPSPANEASRRERAAVVRRSLAKLSSRDREILMLRCFDGLANPEVAALLELNPETTKKRFTRALLRLKQHLRSSGLSGDSP